MWCRTCRPSDDLTVKLWMNPAAMVMMWHVAFGLPWSYKSFIEQACKVGHPALLEGGVPKELKDAVNQHAQWTDEQMAAYRISWCRRWVARSQELEAAEREDAMKRHTEVAKLTKGKKLLVTREILEEIGFADVGALKILSEGGRLAGEMEPSPSFVAQYKPCLATMEQLEMNAAKMNEAVMRMTTSSGDPTIDDQLRCETLLEVEKGWLKALLSWRTWRRVLQSPVDLPCLKVLRLV